MLQLPLRLLLIVMGVWSAVVVRWGFTVLMAAQSRIDHAVNVNLGVLF
jgi:hypothetical protein